MGENYFKKENEYYKLKKSLISQNLFKKYIYFLISE